MWIVLRIAVALFAMFYRFVRYSEAMIWQSSGHHQDKPYLLKTEHDKHGKICSFELGVPFHTGALFKFCRESSSDRFFKALGLSREFQTGDAAFDEKIFLACDHPLLQQHLAAALGCRQQISQLLSQQKISAIWSDGAQLWLKQQANHEPQTADIDALMQLADQLQPVITQVRQQADPFLWRLLTIEAFVWGLFGYAAVAVVEYRFQFQDYHLAQGLLWQYGLAAAFGLLVLLMSLISLFLRGSSRSHRILTESFLLLLLALPVCGIQLVSDLNRHFDDQSAEKILARISSTEKVQHRRALFNPRYTYHLRLAEQPLVYGWPLPAKLTVEERLYQCARADLQLYLEVKPGFLGIPWTEKMSIYPRHARLEPTTSR